MSQFTRHKYNKDARDSLMAGAKQVYDLVSSTLGPKGRNVAINKGYDISIIQDGVSVSKFINPEDKFENVGAMIIREAAEKQVRQVGDGTTISVILGYQIAKEAMVLIDSGINGMSLKQGLEKGRDILIDEVNELSKPITTEEEKVQVATISAKDKVLGEMIGKTYHQKGIDTVFTADISQSSETSLEHQEGISIDHGYLSPYFITDPKTLTATIRDGYILLLDRELEDIYELLPFIEQQLKPHEVRNLVIIAKDVKGTALASLIATKMKGMMNILCIKAPSFGKYQREMLEDIAIMTGGKVIDEASGSLVKDLTFEDLGFAETIKSSRDSTTILGNKGDVKKIEDRLASIKMLLAEHNNDIDNEKLKERLAKMTGGIYVIKTGGSTELEMEEKRERAEDSILAARSAIESGIVPGGEVTFLTARKALKAKNPDEEFAYRILRNAVEKPFEKLLSNAGLNHGYYLAKLEDKDFGWGVNIQTTQIENLIESGIIDPVRVLTEALRSAVSVAILILTSDGVSVVVNESDKAS